MNIIFYSTKVGFGIKNINRRKCWKINLSTFVELSADAVKRDCPSELYLTTVTAAVW